MRFFVDADLLGLAKLLVEVRNDVTYAGDPGGRFTQPCPIQRHEQDEDWIPKVAALGWVVITKDRHMLHRPAERKQILDSSARHIRLKPARGQKKLTKWDQLQIVAAQWEEIEGLAKLPGPWIYAVSRSSKARELPKPTPSP